MPLSQNTLPIYWHMDAALALYPLPDLVVIGDPSKPFEINHQGCTVVNVVSNAINTFYIFRNENNCLLKIFQGSFPKSKFTFKVYVPSTKIIEDSQIPDD